MPEIVNVDQAAVWDGPSGDTWVAREERQDQVFVPYTERLLDAAGVGASADEAARALDALRVAMVEHDTGSGVVLDSRAWVVTALR